MTSLNGNFVKCAHIRCDEYVPRKSPKETPLCSFHETYDTTSPVTPEEMFEMYDTTQQTFYERCKILDELVAELAAKLNADKKNKNTAKNDTMEPKFWNVFKLRRRDYLYVF